MADGGQRDEAPICPRCGVDMSARVRVWVCEDCEITELIA